MSPASPSPYTPKEAWYRSPDWDAAARTEFAGRLARAKPANRPQYRRIKAIALLGTGDPTKQAAAQELLEENLAAQDTPDFEKVIALGVLSEAAQTAGRLDDAERRIREALSIAGPDGSGTNGEEEIRLAEILLEKGDREAIEEAKVLLDRRATQMPLFVKSRFRLCVAQARVSLARGDGEAAEWAAAALRLARETRSGLANHPTLGLVETDTATLMWLQEVASG